MAKYLAPSPKFQAFDEDGAPLAGGLVYTYVTGTGTPLATYTDSTGNTANANPVVLDSRGEANIWFTPGSEYRITVTDSTGGAIYGPIDKVAGSVTPSAYFATLMQASNATQFAGDIFSDGGTVTGTIIMSGAAVNFADDVSVASATTTNIGAAASNNITVTGVATITAFDNVTAGMHRYLTFTGILTLTYNATSMILPTAADIITAAGDTALFKSLGSGNWKCLYYMRADGTALAGTTAAASQAQMEAASSTSVMVTPGRAQYHPGVAKAWVYFDGTSTAIYSSYNVTSVVRNATGNYTITFTTAFSSANYIPIGFAIFPASNTPQAVVSAANNYTKTTTACQIASLNALTDSGSSGPASLVDATTVGVVFFGDQ